MKSLKKINLKGLSEILSEKELKSVFGGSTGKPWPCGTKECKKNADCSGNGGCWYVCDPDGTKHCG